MFARLLISTFAICLSACERPLLSSAGKGFDPTGVSDATSLQELLTGLGASIATRPPQSISENQVNDGGALVSKGRLPDRQYPTLSAYFYCTDCHGTGKEQSSLVGYDDPLAKLAYAIANDLPHLPAPSFAGLVNRDGYFQSEAAERFDAPIAISSDLPAAIQFCSTTLARGRALDEAEMEAVLAYLWSLEWRVGDLGFRGADLAELKRRALNSDEHPSIIETLQELYPLSTKSTTGRLPDDPVAGLETETDPDLDAGAAIWSRTCLHCHSAEGASEHYFGDKASTWEALRTDFREGSLYKRLREGAFAEDKPNGAHMPSFSKEKLSDGQIESLRAFIESKALSQDKPGN